MPDIDRLSVLTATIFLAYASTQFVEIPTRELSAQLPGLYLEAQINLNTAIAVLVAGLTASGTFWLLQDHPALHDRRITQHLLLPALTAWVISILLNNLPAGPFWWGMFISGGALLILVLLAEYIVVDPHDPRQPLATAGLTALSFALFLILAISLRAAALRLILLLPAVVIAAGLVGLRTLHLRLQGLWEIPQAITLALVSGHLAAALHYWPISPVSYGLVLLATVYSLTSVLGSLAEGKRNLQSLLEPGLMGVVLIGVAIWVQ